MMIIFISSFVLVFNLFGGTTSTVYAQTQRQPSYNTLSWDPSKCSDASWGLTQDEINRMDGGCAKITFCKRAGSYDNHKFGYEMDDGSGCLSPGPVMRMEPGKTYGLVLCSDGGQDHPGTNIHTHGPHISGVGNSDDITRRIYKNSCGFYEYKIPADHMGGTNWYHPHLHYHTEEQAGGGAFGWLIIADQGGIGNTIASGTNAERMDVYEFLTDPDRELLLLAAFNTEDDVWSNKNQDSGDSKTYNLEAGVWYRMRILTVNPAAEPETILIDSNCDTYALAHDGAYRFQVPKDRQEKYYLTGASRIDIAIKCDTLSPAGNPYEIGITEGWDFDDDGEDESSSWGGKSWEGTQIIAEINVIAATGSYSSVGPFLDSSSNGNSIKWDSYRPNYLKDLSGATVDHTFTAEMSDSSINSMEYDKDCPLKDGGNNNFVYGNVEEWTHPKSDDHPVHIHIYHQQIVGDCGLGHDVGEYYDTVAYSGHDAEQCKVRFKMIDIYGRVTLHCHILKHEDAGTMGWINVEATGMGTTPTSPCCITGTCSDCIDEVNIQEGSHCEYE